MLPEPHDPQMRDYMYRLHSVPHPILVGMVMGEHYKKRGEVLKMLGRLSHELTMLGVVVAFSMSLPTWWSKIMVFAAFVYVGGRLSTRIRTIDQEEVAAFEQDVKAVEELGRGQS